MSSTKASTKERIEQFLYKEAECCDTRDWDGYLALYDEGCEFYLPQWLTATEYTTDPKTQLAYIYYKNRDGLEDRVFRLRTNKAASTQPPFRTAHMISNVRPREIGDAVWIVKANWATHFFRSGEAGCFFGWSEYTLKAEQSDFRIMKKKSVILNDRIKHVIDFYHV
jgi:anthranilate 1,2-dioxygenase (deaminating, decarboxylating) small subunit